jgi:uncharacterized membrane protein YraQ (UPF0718 family)
VCSIGNVPLAGVLYNGGISFGGVISFMFADLIIIPILVIYRKYYGTKMMLMLLGVFYTTMVAGGYAVELIFGTLGLVPDHGRAQIAQQSISWNYTTWLNIAALTLTMLLLIRFFRTGGREMLAMMGGSPDDMAGQDHPDHDEHDHTGQGRGGGHGAHDHASGQEQHDNHGHKHRR